MKIRHWLVMAFVSFLPFVSYAHSAQLAGVRASPIAGDANTTQASGPPIILPSFEGMQLEVYYYWPTDIFAMLLSPEGRPKFVGDSMTAPVATDATDAGSALNRRLELVEE